MADRKISELSAIAAVASDDELAIVDTSLSETNKVSVESLLRSAPSGTAAAPSIAFVDDPDTGIQRPNANELAISTGGTQRVVVNSSGRVGIGTSVPAVNLHVAVDGDSTIALSNETTITQGVKRSSITKLSGNSLRIRASEGTTSANTIFTRSTTSESIRISPDGNVGIGTSSPVGLLHLNSTGTTRLFVEGNNGRNEIRASNGNLSLFANQDANASGANLTIFYRNGANESMRIASNGNVGIGTTSPTFPLTVTGDNGTAARFTNTAGSASFVTLAGTTTTKPPGMGANADNLVFNTSFFERMRIASNGNVGIGITNPSYILDASGSGDAYMRIRTTTTNTNLAGILFGDAGSGAPGQIVYNNSNNSVQFTVNSGERMRINSIGNVGIGTSSPTELLHLSDDSAHSILLKRTGGAPSEVVFGNENNTAVISNNTNGVAFKTGSTPSEVVRIQADGDVGIGTDDPQVKLDVRGNAHIGDATGAAFIEIGKGATESRFAYLDLVGDTTYTDYSFRILRENGGANSNTSLRHKGTGILGIVAEEAGALTFATSNTERMRITGSNVGIGVSNPQRTLSVFSSSGIAARFDTSTARARIGLKDSATSTDSHVGIGSAGDNFLIYSGQAETVRVTSDGKVGIGTTNPTRTLSISSTDPRVALVDTDAGNEFFIRNLSGSAIYNISGTGKHQFFTGGSERLRINSSGVLLVGTSTSQSILGYHAGAQFATGTGTSSFIRNTADAGSPEIVSAKSRGTSGTPAIVQDGDGLWLGRFAGYDGSSYVEAARISAVVDGTPGTNDMPGALIFSTTADGASSTTEHFRIASNGDLTATDTTIGSNSDSRLKTNIADFAYDLEAFKQYQPKTFDWKNPELHGNKTSQRGFIAQDVEAIDDYWVSQQAVDEDSADAEFLDADRLAKTLKLDKKDAMYVSVIQQLLTKIETLEAKVAALEAE